MLLNFSINRLYVNHGLKTSEKIKKMAENKFDIPRESFSGEHHMVHSIYLVTLIIGMK